VGQQTISQQLAAYATSLRYEDIPQEVVHRAKALIIDTLGCALGGHDGEPVEIARELAGEISSTQPASLLGYGPQTSGDLAVFVNGAMIRYLDFNDGYTSLTSGHPSDSIAALLTAAELAHADGRELITATVVAYEVFCRMCDAANLKQHGFDHVTQGAMASVAGAARLLRLTAEQTSEAINMIVSSNIALFQTRIGNVSMWKGCAYANASRNAIFAVQLARRGMTGPSPIFEGKGGGFFHAVSREPFTLPAFGGQGTQHFKIMDCLMKRYALGQYSQTVVDAALQAYERLGGAYDIAGVHIHTLQTAIDIMAGDPEKWSPANRESADHSMPYVTAVALMYGGIEPEHFEDPHLHDPELLDLVNRVQVSVSEEANRREPDAMLCDLVITMKDGGTQTFQVAYHRGHSRNPMSDDEVAAKYHRLVDPVLPKGRGAELLARLWKLEGMGDCGEIFEMARFDDRPNSMRQH
jgi:2-methylcitrate dehydratase